MLNLIKSHVLRQYLVVITVNLPIITTGLAIVWPSPVLVKFSNATESVLSRPITAEEGSWIVAIGSLIGTFVTVPTAWMLDHIGRKKTVILACLPKLVMSFVLVFANQFWQILLARAFIGASDSILFIVVSLYASEIASNEIRGSLGTILQVMCSIGVVLMLSLGPYLSYTTLNTICAVMILIATLPLLLVPESPNYLNSKGKKEEALKALIYLRGSSILANEELKGYTANNDTAVNKRELFKNRTFLKSLSIGIIIAIASQLIGFNSITFYLQTILVSTQTSVNPELASVVIGCIQLLASFCTFMVTDRFGRKPILAVTLIGMTLGMIGLGVFFQLKQISTIVGLLNYLPLISLITIVFCFSAGVGSVMWSLMAEIYDDKSRSVGMGISMTVLSFFIFLVSKYFALVTIRIGPTLTYFGFAVNCLLFCLFIIFCVPETKGKSFMQIQEDLGARQEDSKEKC